MSGIEDERRETCLEQDLERHDLHQQPSLAPVGCDLSESRHEYQAGEVFMLWTGQVEKLTNSRKATAWCPASPQERQTMEDRRVDACR